MPFVKFTKNVKLKINGEAKFFPIDSIIKLEEKTANLLKEKNVIIVLDEKIDENCLQPFKCELIKNASCLFIEKGMKQYCAGPYKVSKEGEIKSYLAF